MFKNRLFHLSVLLTLAILVLLALSFGSSAQSDMTMTIEVAGNGLEFVKQEQPAQEDGLPLHGNPFIIRGYIYPEGTIGATNGVLEDGSPEFPDLVMGIWICSGFFYGDSLNASTGPYAVTTQIFEFGDTETGENSIMTYGYEVVDIDLPTQRAVIGGTGEYTGASGLQVQTYLGDNPTMGPNLVIEFTLGE